jgi:hypothetical protein
MFQSGDQRLPPIVTHMIVRSHHIEWQLAAIDRLNKSVCGKIRITAAPSL